MSGSPILVEHAPALEPSLLVRTEAVSPTVLKSIGLDPANVTLAEVSGELYSLVCAHLAASSSTKSFKFDIGMGSGCKSRCCTSEDEDDQTRSTAKELGLGVFDVVFDEETIYALHCTLGEVVGTQCGADLMRNLVLIAPRADGIDMLSSFCDRLIAKADATSESKFNIFRWQVQHQYWRRVEVATARPIESVVLPNELKAQAVDDLEEFVSPGTREWYIEHGVPYKRSYLLHGTPGAGKTSLIQAIAGKFKRNVCYLSSLSHPEMTDDNLKNAVQRVPSKSIVVVEDVDALFSDLDGRRKKEGDKSALTFSGVLNALDGVGASTGQIFILTTNHRERLDPALIRNGRVDVHIQFGNATAEQMRLLFSQFYKEASPTLCEQFASELQAVLGERTVSMAMLQDYFVQQRKKPAEVAAKEVSKIIEQAEARGLKLDAKEAGESDADTDKDKKADTADKEAANVEKAAEADNASQPEPTAKSSSSKREIHVHVHVD